MHFQGDASNSRQGDSTFKTGKTLVLKENDEPWFKDSAVVGTAAATANPHKVTGKVDPSFGTAYGTMKEVNAPFSSDCLVDPASPRSGYSRYDKYESCLGHKRESNGYDDSVDAMDEIEQFSDDNNTEYMNNIIMYALCVIIVVLLIYRRS